MLQREVTPLYFYIKGRIVMASKNVQIECPQLPCVGVESHAHLNHQNFAEDLNQVMERAKQAGVARIGQVFLSPEEYHKGVSRFDAYPGTFFLLGIHPTEAFLYSAKVGEEMLELIAKDTRIKCIGEIGLDYYWKEVAPELQKEIFVAQLDLAKQCDYPVAIHCRDAVEDTFAILIEQGFAGRPLLWHCFGGDIALAKRILDAGWHMSIPGPITYPANEALREAVGYIPLDKLMIETDCPFLSPVPMRGKRNEPANLPYTALAMAKAKGIDVIDMWRICGENAVRFFGLE